MKKLFSEVFGALDIGEIEWEVRSGWARMVDNTGRNSDVILAGPKSVEIASKRERGANGTSSVNISSSQSIYFLQFPTDEDSSRRWTEKLRSIPFSFSNRSMKRSQGWRKIQVFVCVGISNL